MHVDLLLIRHGRVDQIQERLLGRSDHGLDADGVADAERAAAACRELPIAAILSSPRRRARETAAVVAAAVSRTVEVVPALDEIDYGEWSGRRFAELASEPEWQRFNERRDAATIPGGEPLESVRGRIETALGDVLGRFARRHIVLVTHAEIIRGALLLAERLPWSAWSRFVVEPGSVTRLRWPRDPVESRDSREQPRLDRVTGV